MKWRNLNARSGKNSYQHKQYFYCCRRAAGCNYDHLLLFFFARYKKVNWVTILWHFPDIFTAELSSSFFQAAKVGSIKGIKITKAWKDNM